MEVSETRVETLARGLTLLRCFDEDHVELSLRELSRLSGLAKPTAMRMLRTLDQLGFVSRHGDLYRVGPQCLALGRLYRFDEDLQNIAAPIMQSLSERVNEVVQLGTVSGTEILYLERFQPRRSVMVSPVVTQPGSTRPIYTTALGKAILALQESSDIETYLENTELAPHTPSTIVDRESLLEELELTKERGYAIDDRETDSEVRCVGAAIFSGSDAPGAAFSISAPDFRLGKDKLEEFGALVSEAAEKVSELYS